MSNSKYTDFPSMPPSHLSFLLSIFLNGYSIPPASLSSLNIHFLTLRSMVSVLTIQLCKVTTHIVVLSQSASLRFQGQLLAGQQTALAQRPSVLSRLSLHSWMLHLILYSHGTGQAVHFLSCTVFPLPFISSFSLNYDSVSFNAQFKQHGLPFPCNVTFSSFLLGLHLNLQYLVM